MRNTKLLPLMVVLLFMSSVFAEENKNSEAKSITELQIKQAISLLITAGILGVEESELVVKKPSILEQLDQQGRLTSGHAESSTICVKD